MNTNSEAHRAAAGSSTGAAVPGEVTTSVNPRLRPKPTVSTPSAIFNKSGVVSVASPIMSPRAVELESPTRTRFDTSGTQSRSAETVPVPSLSKGHVVDQHPTEANQMVSIVTSPTSPHAPRTPNECQRNQREACSSGLDSFEEMKASQISTISSKSAPEHSRRPEPEYAHPGGAHAGTAATLPTKSSLRSSAFQPYSIATQRRVTDKGGTTSSEASLNPFISPMDDADFGERFDEIRRVNRRNTIVSVPASDANKGSSDAANSVSHVPNVSSVDMLMLDSMTEKAIEEDPFGAAPILPHQIMNRSLVQASSSSRNPFQLH